MTHIMLDLETWGRTPGSDIRSIGAVVFDPVAGTVGIPCSTCKGGMGRGNVNDGGDCSDCLNTRIEHGSEFYCATESENSTGYHRQNSDYPHYVESAGGFCKYPLNRDPETVQWWNDQPAEAQAAFANPVDMKNACQRFADWFNETAAIDNVQPSEIRIWCNGPHFDEAILAAVYRAVGMNAPWHYRAPRDFRTITEAAGMTSTDYCNYGTAHNALDDAIAQAMTVCEAYKRLGLQNE